jgi:hypothetical protein
MKSSLSKIAVIGLLSLTSISSNAAIITGDLNYDDTGTHLITGTNGLTYVGWGEIASYNYAQTFAATQTGGLYEDYHIANQNEASLFFSMATGTQTLLQHGDDIIFTGYEIEQSAFGDNYTSWSSSAWFLLDYVRDIKRVGCMSLGSTVSPPWQPSLAMRINWLDQTVSRSDEFSSLGWISSRPVGWLLVSGPVPPIHPVPAPSLLFIFGFGLLGLIFTRKQQRTNRF